MGKSPGVREDRRIAMVVFGGGSILSVIAERVSHVRPLPFWDQDTFRVDNSPIFSSDNINGLTE